MASFAPTSSLTFPASAQQLLLLSSLAEPVELLLSSSADDATQHTHREREESLASAINQYFKQGLKNRIQFQTLQGYLANKMIEKEKMENPFNYAYKNNLYGTNFERDNLHHRILNSPKNIFDNLKESLLIRLTQPSSASSLVTMGGGHDYGAAEMAVVSHLEYLHNNADYDNVEKIMANIDRGSVSLWSSIFNIIPRNKDGKSQARSILELPGSAWPNGQCDKTYEVYGLKIYEHEETRKFWWHSKDSGEQLTPVCCYMCKRELIKGGGELAMECEHKKPFLRGIVDWTLWINSLKPQPDNYKWGLLTSFEYSPSCSRCNGSSGKSNTPLSKCDKIMEKIGAAAAAGMKYECDLFKKLPIEKDPKMHLFKYLFAFDESVLRKMVNYYRSGSSSNPIQIISEKVNELSERLIEDENLGSTLEKKVNDAKKKIGEYNSSIEKLVRKKLKNDVLIEQLQKKIEERNRRIKPLIAKSKVVDLESAEITSQITAIEERAQEKEALIIEINEYSIKWENIKEKRTDILVALEYNLKDKSFQEEVKGYLSGIKKSNIFQNLKTFIDILKPLLAMGGGGKKYMKGGNGGGESKESSPADVPNFIELNLDPNVLYEIIIYLLAGYIMKCYNEVKTIQVEEVAMWLKINALKEKLAQAARLEAQRQAEAARLEAQRQAEAARLEAQRQAEAARLEAQRQAVYVNDNGDGDGGGGSGMRKYEPSTPGRRPHLRMSSAPSDTVRYRKKKRVRGTNGSLNPTKKLRIKSYNEGTAREPEGTFFFGGKGSDPKKKKRKTKKHRKKKKKTRYKKLRLKKKKKKKKRKTKQKRKRRKYTRYKKKIRRSRTYHKKRRRRKKRRNKSL